MSRSNTTRKPTPAATTSHPATKRGRGRQQKTTRQRSPSQSSPPTATIAPLKKRRKQRQASKPIQDNIFQIKNIIGEKFIDSKRFFEIDWEDNPVNGEVFKPTWVGTICQVWLSLSFQG